MTAQREVESKWALTAAGFEALVSSCREIRAVDQLNIYFDDSWALARAGATCRLRLAPCQVGVFTLKLPGTWTTDGTRSAREIEMPVPDVFVAHYSLFRVEIDRSSLAPEFSDALRPLNVSRLARVGRMRNRRRLMQLPSGASFELDRFSLPGGEVGYEVEVEEPDDRLRSEVVALIRGLVPSARPSTTSKFQRFTEAAQRLRSSGYVRRRASAPHVGQ